MNNTTEITLNGKRWILTFGQMANETIFDLQAQNETISKHKIINDVVYGGIVNECYLERKPLPKYRDICNAVEDLFENEEGKKQIADVLNVYNESKAGKKLQEIAENVKKKLEESQSS